MFFDFAPTLHMLLICNSYIRPGGVKAVGQGALQVQRVRAAAQSCSTSPSGHNQYGRYPSARQHLPESQQQCYEVLVDPELQADGSGHSSSSIRWVVA